MADMSVNETTPTPHSEGFFSRLLDMFGLSKRPAAGDSGEVDDPVWGQDANAEWWRSHFKLSNDRRERYRIFAEMDTFSLVMSVLDVYSEETTQPDLDKQRSVWVESKNAKLTKAGDECLTNIRIEDDVSALVREFAKNGDAFRRLIYATEKGVLGWKHVEPQRVTRLQDKYSRLIGYKEDGKQFRNKKSNVSWPWDYVHFRLLGKDSHTSYGTSLLEPMFRVWRNLTLSEDSMLMYRLRRAGDRNVVFVDVGNMEEHDAIRHLNKWRKKFRKHEFIDPASKDYKKQYNPLTPVEDIFMPVRGEMGGSKIEALSTGGADPAQVYDIEHFRNSFFAAAKVPKAFLGFEGEINAKATLMQQDIRFARTCKRIRRSEIYGLRTVLDIHYALLPDYQAMVAQDNYVVQTSPISYLDEFERLELMRLRYEIVLSMSQVSEVLRLDAKTWARYILTDYAKLPDEMVAKLVAKADQPPEESYLTQKQRDMLRDKYGDIAVQNIDENLSGDGGYDLTENERSAVAEAVHSSPALRRVIGDLTSYFREDSDPQIQVDASMIPPLRDGKPVVISDDYEDDKEAKQLKEDLDNLQTVNPKGV